MEMVRPLMKEQAEIDNRLGAVKNLFWASVTADFPETRDFSVGIRCDGQIVTFKEKCSHGVMVLSGHGESEEILRHLGLMR